jgi:hypothetical protein
MYLKHMTKLIIEKLRLKESKKLGHKLVENTKFY